MSRKPLGLALQLPTEQEQSYRVDEHGAFVHGQINIGAEGMSIAQQQRGGGGYDTGTSQNIATAASSGPSLSLSSEEQAELQLLRKDLRLEDLEIGEKLGEGNSSVVHRARDTKRGIESAVKRINIYDKSKRHQIIKELHTLYRCDCPHLISFHGAFFKEGSISIVLELMDVGSLSDVLSVVPYIEEPELAYFAKPVLQGLDYLRRMHKVHRDIKPSNICLNSKAEAKLSDFGITTSLDNTLAACNSFIGTMSYMGPERLMGRTYKYPSDVWSAGIVFLECALGKFPYDLGGVYLDMMQNVINGPSPTLPSYKDAQTGAIIYGTAASSTPTPRWSKEFANFIDCCLSKDPDQRSTAEELLLHPWFTKQKNSRTPQQMQAWIGEVKNRIKQRQKQRREAEEGGGGMAEERNSMMDTRTNGGSSSSVGDGGFNNPHASSHSSSMHLDPFEAGYNQTNTSDTMQSSAAARNNIPAGWNTITEIKR